MILLPRFFASKIKRILMYLFNFSFPERLVKVIKRYLFYNELCRTFLTDLPENAKVLKVNFCLLRAKWGLKMESCDAKTRRKKGLYSQFQKSAAPLRPNS